MRVGAIASLLLAFGAGSSAAHATASRSDRCAPAEGLHFICSTGAAEEIVRIPGTNWLIASGLNVGSPAQLHVVDVAAKQARALAVVLAPASSSCRPPDPSRWSMDGLAITPGVTGGFRLFAANHGDRLAIEIFDVAIGADGPEVRWTGCAPLPPGTLANGIAALGAHDIFVTSFHALDDPLAWVKMARGDPTGSVWRWQEGTGFSQVDVGAVSGANGIALSEDGRSLYLSAWSERTLVIIDRRSGARRRITLDFLPDNIHIGSDGRLLVGGQRTSVAAIGACGAQCPQPWVIARVDPANGRSDTLVHGVGSAAINYACGALELDDALYITVRGDDRIAYRARERRSNR
jgi:hypothetical protein